MTKTKILITGANGFVGSNILKALQSVSHVSLIAACRDTSKLPGDFKGEIRQGDLCDPDYRKSLVKDVDIICHTGTWAAMWDHKKMENDFFYQPTIDLIEQSIQSGVKRFLMTSSVAIAKHSTTTSVIDDFSQPCHTGFWPHLDYLVDIDTFMKLNSTRGMQMITMRLGHFVGAGNKLGLVPALVPRLKTYFVPWLAKGKSRMPLISDSDIAMAFIAAISAKNLHSYESFNICGRSFPTTREVVNYISEKTGVPKPLYTVPFAVGYLFAWLMEKLFPVLPGKGPFLTRSIVHLAEDWYCTNEYARKKLGYIPVKTWQAAMDEALDELKKHDYSWPYLSQNK